MPSKRQRQRQQRKKMRAGEDAESSLGYDLESGSTGVVEQKLISISKNDSKQRGRPPRIETVTPSFSVVNNESAFQFSTPKSSRIAPSVSVNISPITNSVELSPPHKKAKIFDLTFMSSILNDSHTQHLIESPKSAQLICPAVPFMDFSSIEINFATEKNVNCLIWRKAGLSLYENDFNSSGPRQIETYWNDLSLYLNDSFIYAFLCYISSLSERKTVVIDSLFTDIQNMQILCGSSIKNAAFNYDPNLQAEIILMPLIFQNPDHWTLLIYDSTFGTFYIDSLQMTSLNASRLERIKDLINELTDVSPDSITVQNVPPTQLTLQSDGNSCGYFVCLFAESYIINNRSFILPSLDINLEKRRILWHINELYSKDNFAHQCRSHSIQSIEALNNDNLTFSRNTSQYLKTPLKSPSEDSFTDSIDTCKSRVGRPPKRSGGHSGSGRSKKMSVTPQDKSSSTHNKSNTENVKLPFYNVESNVDQSCPRDGEAAFVCIEPVLDTTPDVILSHCSDSGIRRSSRIQSRLMSATLSDAELDPLPVTKFNDITKRCHVKHEGFPCADARAQHTTHFYDSGLLGEKICDYCSALLFNSEAQKINGKFSSGFCCNHGSIVLPPFTQHPPTLTRYLSGESQEAKEFLSHQNLYNSLLAFASVSVGYRQSSLDGDVCYLLNGEFTRQIGSLLPGRFVPSFSQLYILDPAAAVQQRTENIAYGGDRINQNTLRKLDFIVRKYHPLAKELQNFHSQYLKTLQDHGPDAVINFRLTLIAARDAPASVQDPSLHPRQANLPDEGNTLFALWTESEQAPFLRGIWLTNDEGQLRKFPPNHPLTDSLCYPLLFPHGDDGFHEKIPRIINNIRSRNNTDQMEVDEVDSDNDLTDGNESIASSNDSIINKNSANNFMSIRSYIRYRMALRKDETIHHILSAGGGLSQKFILDYAARIDANVCNFLRRPELNLRATLPENAIRWLSRNAGLSSTEELGSIVMFRKYQPGTRAYFQHKFYDATTIMSRFKKPGYASFFLTFTTNPRWPEISRNFLHKGQRTVDRYDLICRIYEDKLRHLHYLIDKKHILGKMIGQECREFQKKYGGPHAHRVYHTNLLSIPEIIDNLIWAYIPAAPNNNDKSDWANFIRKIRELIPKYQFHDCGPHCLNRKGKCKKGFPKPFSKFTILHDDRPAVYLRPSPEDGGQTLSVKRGRTQIIYDNSRISAYNPYLLVHFETHHNLESAYGQSTNLKYLYKYPFKGPSFSYVKTAENDGTTSIDEPAYYAKMLYRSPPEAYSRIMSFKYAFLSHTVIPLSIHLPGQQKIYMRPGQAEAIAQQIQAGQLPETPLTAYWKQCDTDNEIAKILFERMPEKYSFNKAGKYWKKRNYSTRPQYVKVRKPIIGRLYPVSPRSPEHFALYLLMKHFPGTPLHLKTIDSHVCATFLEAARLRGLIDDCDVWIRTMEEGAAALRPAQMRQLLANILVFGSTENCLIDGALLWERFLPHFYDARCTDAERPLRIERSLALLERLLVAQGRQCKDFGLPTPTISIINDPQRGLNEFFFPQHVNDDDVDDTVDTSAFERGQLNTEQRTFFDFVKNAFINSSNARLFYLCGDGGTGKTFLLNYVLYQLRRIGAKIIPTASTGMASTRFYVGGTTVHSAFKFGINVEAGKLPSIPFDSFFGRRIIECDIIIIDEMTMLERVVFENIDALCRLMCFQNKHLPFAGKCVIISGDWKQSLPVVIDSYGSPAQVAACIQSSPLYPLFTKFKLIQSMRVNPNEIAFLKWLDDVGRGTNGESVAIPKDMLVDSRDELINWVFDHGFNMPSNEMLKRLLLATTNRIVDINNSQIAQSLAGDFVEYFSVDKATEENPFAVNAAEFDVAQLNQLSPLGMPTHIIRLKTGAVIVLLVNLNTSKGLCNGTRLLIKKLTQNLIECEALTGGSSATGIIVGIPRNRHTYKDKRPDGVSFERFQFPVRLAFAMTVIKAQGQTATRLGIDFTEEPFSHGQLYTALSRATSRENIRIFAPNKPIDENGNPLIRNVIAHGLDLA